MMERRKRKDWVDYIDLKDCDAILEYLYQNDFEVYEIQGGLLDNYACELNDLVKFNKRIVRKYMIIREVYLNGWSSTLELRLTDDAGKFDEFVNEYEKEREIEEMEYIANL